jgi:uncharacterized protein with HEPN domain
MKNDAVYLKHILDAANQIQGYVRGMIYETFLTNRLVQDGVIRQFEIIGEATKNLSEGFRSAHDTLPWKDMAGMRDKLIHQYFGVDLSAVWASVENDIPAIKEKLIEMLRSYGD